MGISDMILQAVLLYYGSPTFNGTPADSAAYQRFSWKPILRFLANFDALSLFHTSDDPKSLPCLAPLCEKRIQILRWNAE